MMINVFSRKALFRLPAIAFCALAISQSSAQDALDQNAAEQATQAGEDLVNALKDSGDKATANAEKIAELLNKRQAEEAAEEAKIDAPAVPIPGADALDAPVTVPAAAEINAPAESAASVADADAVAVPAVSVPASDLAPSADPVGAANADNSTNTAAVDTANAAGAAPTAAAASGEGSDMFAFLNNEKLIEWNNKIDGALGPVAHWAGKIFFVGVDADSPASQAGGDSEPILDARGKPVKIWYVVIWLGLAAVILTLAFGFINIWGLPLAFKTLTGRYSSPDDPGQISHFQALTSALSGTVGLGNIAGVAIGISLGGPGAVFWMVLAGFLGMTTKFCECTLGVKYRRITKSGRVQGGPMYYLADGFKERDMAGLGKVLAILFAIFCAFAAIGAGNLFQVNQAYGQLLNVTEGKTTLFVGQNGEMIFGIGMAVIVGLVVLFGIKAIGRVTSILVPLMCFVYVVGCLGVLIKNVDDILPALNSIWESAFSLKAGVGAVIAAVIWGLRRAAFSNEAGFGSSAIAHSAVKTKYAASEGLVALLEPFVDTVIVCSMTALVILTTGVNLNADPQSTAEGIELTSRAFATVFDWFPYVLSFAAIVFAISTMITWCYYGEQAFGYLFGGNIVMVYLYKLIFIAFIAAGAVLTLDNVMALADGPFFALCVINLIGVYALLPVIRRELRAYREYVRSVKRGVPGPPAEDIVPENDVASVDDAAKYGDGA